MFGPSAADARMRISLYLGREVPSHEDVVDTINEVLDRAEADRAQVAASQRNFSPSKGLSRETLKAAIERVSEATYEPRLSLHHPSCPNVQPGVDVIDYSRCTRGCSP